MRHFARLLDDLLHSPSRLTKQRLLADYFRRTPDPDRGYALAALTGSLSFAQAKPALIRDLVVTRVDPELFGWSWDFVGDLAETAALIWPQPPLQENAGPGLAEVVEQLEATKKSELPALLATWLDALDSNGRWALLKLITGELRVGVSARLTTATLAETAGRSTAEIEEVWHGLGPPYAALFAWIEGRAEKPAPSRTLSFLPVMLATALDEAELPGLDPAAYRAEWKWDGIRVQLVARNGECRLFSRAGEDVGKSFPDILEAADFDAVLDGELLVHGQTPESDPASPAGFNDLQQRLNRKTVTAQMLERYPAFIRLYDVLRIGEEDLRPLPYDTRRERLKSWLAEHPSPRFDFSPAIAFTAWDELNEKRRNAAAINAEGIMLKSGDSAYLAGRPKGPWFKWKRDPATIDCVLMYAQRGSGKRSSFYSDYTFGCWREGTAEARELVPVGKAYFGFTDAELLEIDKWVRAHTTNRFGPVREVEPRLVFELAFDSVSKSNRHKSGVALRFPRISRIRWDKPAGEADEVKTLEKLIS